MAVGSGVIWSFGALTARLAKQSDAWQYLLWRSAGVLIVMEIVARCRGERFAFRKAFVAGPLMVAATVALLVASLAYVYAVKTTTAANAAFLSSITPLVAVLLARFVLRERLTRVTLVAIAVALVGLVIMVSASRGANASGSSAIGNLSALMSSVGFATYTVCVRSDPSRDWSPVLPGYATLMILLCGGVSLAHGRTLRPPFHDVALALLHGGVLIVVGTYLFNAASRVVPAVPMTVFAQSETVFAPFWVFLVLSERPARSTLFGASLILVAVLGKALFDTRQSLSVGLPI